MDRQEQGPVACGRTGRHFRSRDITDLSQKCLPVHCVKGSSCEQPEAAGGSQSVGCATRVENDEIDCMLDACIA